MTREVISTPNAPAAIGPYSQAIAIDGLLFCSGQIPLDPATGQVIEGDVSAQTRQVMENIRALLAAAGTSLEKVVKTTIFLADMNDFATVNAIYGEYFPENPPARSTVQVARLPRDVQVEVEVIVLR
ncbi:RidA family protein [Herpetosiphon giganteus]|uniref:RidA family protein n=1 Tax=Herpetosiphon giganteus TaxID=2029754 RepID=UPI00195C2797|nr:RidA family protein [Herpetosiphon giganteus]MBM7841890.1 2-iminobutanoate/2-iminopropanoate deaminase [Herpetosiphon giganteus]